MSERSDIAQRIALEIHGLSDAVVIALVSCTDEHVSRMASREAARRMVAERPR
jgi:hypothetical protein